MASNTTPLSIFTQNRAAIELLVQDTVNYMVDQFGQSRTSFTVASAYGQILFVLENLTQFILFYIEDSITELNINTATRTSSVQGLAVLAGHNPTRAIAATGQVSLIASAAGSTVPGSQVIISNHAQMKCLNNGLTYILDLQGDEIRIPTDGSTNTTGYNITQGTVFTVPFTGTGNPYQSFSVNLSQGSLIDNYDVTVYVNGTKWNEAKSLLDMPYQGKYCMIRTALVSGGIDVIFGNGNLGAMPPPGATIKVEYLTTSGKTGNLYLADGENAIFQWIDSGLDMFGEEVDLNQMFGINCTVSPGFGSDPEPTALTRLVAPRTSRSYVLANPTNYIVFFEKFNQFSIIDAYTKTNVNTNNPDDRVT